MTVTWSTVALGEVIRRIKDEVLIDDSQTYARLKIRLNGKGIVLRDRIIGQEIGTKRQFLARTNQLVLSKIDARNGAFGILSADCDRAIITGNFWAFDADSSRLLPAYFDYLTKTPLFLDFCIRASEGTTNRRYLQEDRFLRQEIRLPPLPEQRRIVARIEELAAKIDEAHELREKATQETEQIYAASLSQRMEPTGKGWVRETVDDVIVSMDAGWSPQCDDIPARDGQWGVLKTTSVQWCEFRPYENKALPGTLDPVPELAIEEGDVLVTRAGPRKRVGVVAVVRTSEPRLTISDKLIRLRPDLKKIEPRFLELSLASPFSQEHLVYRKSGLADAQVNISQSILRATPLAYPSLFEQSHIVAELDALQTQVHALQKTQAETAAELDALLPSILDKALKGEL
jgi:type I restriction enzyme S subunit